MGNDAIAEAGAMWAAAETPPKRLSFFARYLTFWVAACMAVGVLLGKLLPGAVARCARSSAARAARST